MRIWSRLGVCAGVLGFAYIVLAEVTKRSDAGKLDFWIAGWCLVGLGSFLALLCVFLYREELRVIRAAMFPPKKDEDAAFAPEEVEVPTKALNRLHGAIIVLSVGAMMVILFRPARTVEARPPAPVTNALPKEVVVTQAVEAPQPVEIRPVQFPDIKFQGLTLRPGANSVMVERRTYFEGDYVQGARILVITPTKVLIEVDGQTKLVPLPDF